MQVFSKQVEESAAQKQFYQFADEGEEQPIEELSSLFLWDTNLPIFEIFQILRHYVSEMSGIPTDLLLRLIDERKLPLEKSLAHIPYIFSGYWEEKQRRTDS